MATTKMNKRVKRLWLKALRSGRFRQGQLRLCRVNSESDKRHCCLGVLEELAVEQGVIRSLQTRERDAERRSCALGWTG
jgi:hypothetical protein